MGQRHVAYVLFGTHRGPHIVRPSRPHKLNCFYQIREFCRSVCPSGNCVKTDVHFVKLFLSYETRNFFLLPIQSFYHCSTYLFSAQPDLCSAPRATRSSSVVDHLHLLSESPIVHFAMHHLISGITFLSHSASLAQNTLSMMSLFTSHLLTTLTLHHTRFIPGSNFFSTNLFHHSKASSHVPGLSSQTILDQLRPTLLNGFSFFSYFFFILGRAVKISWLITGSFPAHLNIASLLTYLLT